MGTTPRSGSVEFVAYSLEVSGGAGSYAHYLPADERENESPPRTKEEQENQKRLGAALDEEPDGPPKPLAAIEKFQESADAVTGKIEQADQLLKAGADGRLLDLGNVNSEIDALLDLFGRLDRAGRFEEELRLMRSLNGLLALTLRWLDLIRSLRSLLRSAEAAGHAAGQAFARHELGSLYLCAGQPEKAVRHLQEADRLQKQLGGVRANCATRHNLDSAERDVDSAKRLALHTGGGSRSPTPLQRLVLLAGAIAIAGGAGAGIALAVHHNRPGNRPPTTPTTSAQSGGPYTVVVLPKGNGGGSVRGQGLNCGSDCTTTVVDGGTITLTAMPAGGSTFAGWSGSSAPTRCGRAPTCVWTVHDDATAMAIFSSKGHPTPPPVTVPAPSGLAATRVGPTAVHLTWRAPTGTAPALYYLYRDSRRLAPVFGGSTTYADTGLTPSTTYEYTVQAVAAGGQASKESSSLTKTTPPSAPTNLVATVPSYKPEIDLTWTKPANDTKVTGYVIYRVEETVVPNTVVPDTDAVPSTPVATVGTVPGYPNLPQTTVTTVGPFVPYTDADQVLDYDNTYGYVVEAVDSNGNSSEPSNLAWAPTPGG